MEGTHLTPRLAPLVRLTYEDFLLFPDDGKRHEIIDGEHYVTPSPNLRHQALLGRLHLAFARYLEAHSIGWVWFAPLDVLLSKHDIVEPDLLYVSEERRSILTKQNVQGAPDLAVEVLSPGTRRVDEGVKRQAYERCGIGEYWIVDPVRNQMKVFRRRESTFDAGIELSADRDDVLSTPILPDFNLSLRALFREDD